MARTIDQIFEALVAEKESRPELAGLTSTSKVAIWRMLLYIDAVCAWSLEKLFDIHVASVREILATEKPGRPKWYETIAKRFQYGFDLVEDEDYYDNAGVDEADIAASLIIKYASCSDIGSSLRLKIAGESGGDLAPISPTQLTAFQEYIRLVKYAGVRVSITNSVADDLKLRYRIYFNPLVLDDTGARLDGTDTDPIAAAIDEYLKSGIRFNGYFVTKDLTARIESVEGVQIATPILVQSRYGALAFSDITDLRQPDSGYLRIEPANLTLEFIPSPI